MVIVESHHHVLRAWAEYRVKLNTAPRLITLDHHTDTSAPFRTYFKSTPAADAERLRTQWLGAMDFNNLDTIETAMSKLDHDEHIVAAIECGIISSAFVVAHNARDTDQEIYRKHRIACVGVDRKINSSGLIKSDCDKVLESSFLRESIAAFNRVLDAVGEPELLTKPYIFDIDLDYLNTLDSIVPLDSTVLRTLAGNAGLITIARETQHVRLCAMDENVTSDFLLPRLKALLGFDK